MDPVLLKNLATLAVFATDVSDTEEFATQVVDAVNEARTAEPDFDDAVEAAFGVAAAVAAKTPGEKDEEWVTTLRELYIAIKDPETGLIEDLFTFIRNRREAKRAEKGE